MLSGVKMRFLITIFTTIIIISLSCFKVDAGAVTKIGGPGIDESSEAVFDIEGSYIITGSFSGTVDFDLGTNVYNLISNGASDAFVAKYDTEGKLVWAFNIGGPQSDRGNSVAVDYLGDIVITGYFTGTVDFDPSSGKVNATSKGGKDIFVVKYNYDGVFQWVKTFGSASDDEGIDVHLDFMGYPYITGYFNLSINLNPITPVDPNTVFQTRGGTDIFILCLSDSGNYQFGFSAGGAGNDVGNAIKPMGDGGFCVGGSFTQRANFGLSDSLNLVSKGGTDAFIVKYDFFQNVQWAYRFGDVNADMIRPGTIEGDDEDNLYFGGSFIGSVDINPNGNEKLTGTGLSDGFIAKFNSSGQYLWGFAIGGAKDDGINKISLDSNRNVYISGYYTDKADFDPNPGTTSFLNAIGASGILNGFAARYNQDGKFMWAGGYGNIGTQAFNNVMPNSITTDMGGISVVTGPFLEKTIFYFQNELDSLSSVGATDIFALILGADGKFRNNQQPGNPSIVLNSPIGGEVWTIGQNYNITWKSQNINQVKLNYQTSSSTGWKSIATNVAAALGSYQWNIPNSPSKTCKVKITSIDDNLTNDTSASYFTIEAPPSLKLTTPVGGENWFIGEKYNIKWNAVNINNVKIEYQTSSTSDWFSISPSVTGSAGGYQWTIPNTPSTTCKVRISNLDDNTTSDVSAGTFTIQAAPALALLSPSGGEKYTVGTNVDITWDYDGTDDFPVIVSYRINDTDSWHDISNVNSVKTKKLNWLVPNQTSTTCKVRIADSPTNGFIYSDSTGGYFTITDGDGVQDNILGVTCFISNVADREIKINLKSENHKIFSAELYYLSGAPTGISAAEFSSNAELDVSALPVGFYMVKIAVAGKEYIRKVIISR